MKARPVKVSSSARRDLLGIWDHVSGFSLRAANRLHLRFLDHFRSLGENPGIGRSRHDIRPNLRTFPVRRYIIIYQVHDTVEILRVYHGALDVERLLDEEIRNL